jgi:hypothetical protein
MYKDRRFCHCWRGSLQMNVMAKWIIAREKSFLFRTIAKLCCQFSIWTTEDENWQLQCNFEKEDLLWLQNKLKLQDNFKQGSLLWLQCNSNEQLHWWQNKAQNHTTSEEHNRQSAKRAQTTKGPMFLLHIDKRHQLHTKQNSVEKSLLPR